MLVLVLALVAAIIVEICFHYTLNMCFVVSITHAYTHIHLLTVWNPSNDSSYFVFAIVNFCHTLFCVQCVRLQFGLDGVKVHIVCGFKVIHITHISYVSKLIHFGIQSMIFIVSV